MLQRELESKGIIRGTLPRAGRHPKRRTFVVLALGVLLLSATAARGDELRRLVREGNRAYDAENYDEALEKYRSAEVESPESPYLYFNIANALLKQEKYDEAIDEFQKVYTRENPGLGAAALYNIGVGQYRKAEQAIGIQDYKEALKLLEACMQSNREAMKIDPADEDPKYNYEQAKRKWKEVLDELKKQQEQQKNQQKDQQDQNQKNQQDQQQKGQDQQKQDEQQQGEQKQDQQQQGEQKQQGGQKQEDQPSTGSAQAQPQPQVGEMTPEEAERILNSLPEESAEELRQFLQRHVPSTYRLDKDW